MVDTTLWIKGADNSAPQQPGYTYIHGDAYNRPIIKLKDGTFSSVSDPANARPIFQLRHIDSTKASPWIYWNMLQHLVFDLGNNPGATAIEWDAAQDTRVSHIQVIGTQFLVGIKGLPGANQSNLDLEVVGGQYGIFLKDAAGMNLTGIRLRNQSKGGIILKNFRSNTIVGLEVLNCGGPAIYARGTNYDQGIFTIEDASIHLTDANTPAFDLNDRPFIAQNVYLIGSRKISSGTHAISLPAGNGLTKIRKALWAPAQVNDHPAYTYFNDTMRTNHEILEWEPASEVPDNLLSQHLPDEIFAFNHPEAVNALDFPGTTQADQIQAALESPHRVVYLPAGEYSLNKSILLRNGKVLIGDPGKRSILVPSYDFTIQRFLVETENSLGWNALQDLYFGTRDRKNDGAIHWQISHGFILNVRASLDNGIMEYESQTYRFSGNAGGKFYGITDHRNIFDIKSTPLSPNFRKVIVENTKNPITFYGLNLERGGTPRDKTSPPFLDIVNASNIRVLGWKCEPDLGAVVRLSNAKNIKISSLFTHRISDYPLVVIVNGSNHIEINFLGTKQASLGKPMILPYTDILKNHLLVSFRKGVFNDSIFLEQVKVPVRKTPILDPLSPSIRRIDRQYDLLGRKTKSFVQ